MDSDIALICLQLSVRKDFGGSFKIWMGRDGDINFIISLFETFVKHGLPCFSGNSIETELLLMIKDNLTAVFQAIKRQRLY